MTKKQIGEALNNLKNVQLICLAVEDFMQSRKQALTERMGMVIWYLLSA